MHPASLNDLRQKAQFVHQMLVTLPELYLRREALKLLVREGDFGLLEEGRAFLF
jgi:hypothetical protein